jgi:hypothetical protein
MRSHRWPHLHRRLDRIALSHRFSGGGIALAKLIDNTRASRFTLQSSEDWIPARGGPDGHGVPHSPNRRHWRGRFKLGAETIDFSLALHRPLPSDAILKRASWLGERAGDRWFWHLALTIEEHPVASARSATTPCAGLDLGWRLLGEGTKHEYLRIGMLWDSEGRAIELRLPLCLRPNRPEEWRGLLKTSDWQQTASALVECGKDLAGNHTLGPAWPRSQTWRAAG